MTSLYSGSLRKDYARFAVPCIISLVVYSIYGMVDGLFVSRFIGPEALASLNIGHPFLSVLFCIAVIMAVGANTMIAEALGRGDREKACRLFTMNLCVTAAVGIVVSLLVLVFLRPFCVFLGADSQLIDNTSSYVGTIAAFAAFFILEYGLEFFIKTNGKPFISVIVLVGSCLLNIFLDWLFMGRFNMGVFGAAFATGLSQLLTVAAFLICIIADKDSILKFVPFRLDLKLYRKMVPLGFADGSIEVCSAAMIWLYNRVVLKYYGADGVAVYAIMAYVMSLAINLFLGVSQGMEPLVSYHKGAENYNNCRKILKLALITGLAAGTVVFCLAEIGAPVLSLIYFDSSECAIGSFLILSLRKYVLGFLIMGFNIVSAGFLTAVMRPVGAMVISIGRSFAIHALVLIVITEITGGEGIFWSAVIAEALTAIVTVILIKRTPEASGVKEF